MALLFQLVDCGEKGEIQELTSLLSLLLIQLSLHPSLFVPCTQRVRVYFSAGSLELEWADDLDLGVV